MPRSTEWSRLLGVQRDIQRYIPDLDPVGGTASALHAHHRVSLDADHALVDLRTRFLLPGSDDTIVEVEDILDRGSLADWQDLARKVLDDPEGGSARSVAQALAHNEWYGTTVIWKRFLARHGCFGRPEVTVGMERGSVKPTGRR